MNKRQGVVTLKGKPITLVGPELKVGDKIPPFVAAVGMMDTFASSALPAKATLFNVVPSLDTPVCTIQTKKFNEAVAAMGDRVAAYTVSLDLPFAMKRFCGAENVASIQNLSDAHDGSFGKGFGVLIEGTACPLLARAVFVADASGTVTYAETVGEIAAEPDYAAALAALEAAAK